MNLNAKPKYLTMKSFFQLREQIENLLEAKNLGQQYEIKIIKGLEKIKGGGKGTSLSGRGSDSIVQFKNKKNGKTKEYNMGIKAHGACSGQIQFRYENKKWFYIAKSNDQLGSYLAKILNDTVPGWMNDHYGEPKVKPGDREGLIKFIRSVTKDKGELIVPFEYEPKELAEILHIANNGDDLIHIQDKGTYALTKQAAKETDLTWIGDAIDKTDAEYFLSLRHRVKVHSSSKGVYSLTAEMHLDTDLLEDSDFDVAKYLKIR